jgi:hypothetical protein
VEAPDERSLVARSRTAQTADSLRTALQRTVPVGVHPIGYAAAVGAAIAQVLTILWTWNLWTERDSAPNLPVVSILSHVNWAPPLILLALLTVASPRRVAPLFCGVYALAVLGDQVRLQPEVVSLALLMTRAATTRRADLPSVVRSRVRSGQHADRAWSRDPSRGLANRASPRLPGREAVEKGLADRPGTDSTCRRTGL